MFETNYCPVMKTRIYFATVIAVGGCLLDAPKADAATNLFFNAAQTTTVTASNITTVTIQSGDYRFTYSRDGWFTGGVGLTNPVGRFFSVVWPSGVQAQAYTAGPLTGTGANIILKRADGKPFDLQSFTGKILLNTAGAGGAFEIMPLLNGNDAFPDPLQYDCTGYGGQSFSYVTDLHNYDTYQIHMWGDFALTALALIDTNAAPPTSTNIISASISPVGSGTVVGAGSYPSNSTCTLTATANPAWSFQKWTESAAQVSASASYTFTVRSNRALMAVFVPLSPELNIALAAPGALVLTWPTNSFGFTLQRNMNLTTTNWLAVTNTPIVTGTNFQISLTPQDPYGGFFRLKYP